MKTELLSTKLPDAIPRAARVLDRGGLVAFPTDTVYGLAAQITNADAVEKLYQAKVRDRAKAIAVLMSSAADLVRVAKNINTAAQRLADHFWPGPLTLVVARHPSLPKILAPTPTIGVRVPDHPDALALMDMSGPLAVTSANLAGDENTRTANDVLAQLDGCIDLILDGGRTPGGQPSTVVDCTTPQIKILRPGPISQGDLQNALS
ncbi:MAG: L-threonylcarbamoyladenylate synthase [Chloroflexota bacterium]|nr:L-threonylcarbamoyladenylate synthase [Chloroflexota bacterium]